MSTNNLIETFTEKKSVSKETFEAKMEMIESHKISKFLLVILTGIGVTFATPRLATKTRKLWTVSLGAVLGNLARSEDDSEVYEAAHFMIYQPGIKA